MIYHQTFHSREEAKQAVFEYIEVFLQPAAITFS
ncbi:MAG: IS3 family transposase [Nitrosomonas sp.]|nr:IS3 family transposase [Nitrosomonas sp.]MBP6074951.1 IS3 family transposase [Nitrosomonas sp.]